MGRRRSSWSKNLRSAERLLVTPETKIEGVVGGRLKTGDRIVAQITDDRKALSIKLQIPDGR
ncbi:MAG: hypothetical protein IPM88_15675 [Nitrospira sp.]|nr:hypothetical protein [Nitrospira sp.]